jgi:pimeloyl-ACP methyl ester carboxylesterase
MMIDTRYQRDLAAARSRVRASGSRLVETPLGKIEYIDCGHGAPVLWVHGILGGADQGPAMAQTYLGDGYRIIAVSRFGYLGSPLPPDASPAAQADLYACLLDTLGIDTVTLVGTSAGSASSLQFALRHPGRCTALVLWSMAVPPYPKPALPLRLALQTFFGSDFLIWAVITYFPGWMQRIMGVPAPYQRGLAPVQLDWLSTVMVSFLPVSLRIEGIMNDVCVSNPGMNDTAIFEKIAVPKLIIHAVDDPMPPFTGAREIANWLPNTRFVEISDGGHLLLGHLDQVQTEIAAFIQQHAGER